MDSPTCKPDMRLRHPNLERPVIPRYARKAGLGNLGKVFGTLAEFCSSLIPLSRSEPKSSFEKQAIGTRRRFFTDNQSQMDVVDEVVEMFSISTLQEGSKHVKSINPSVNSSFLSVTEDTSSATNSQKFVIFPFLCVLLSIREIAITFMFIHFYTLSLNPFSFILNLNFKTFAKIKKCNSVTVFFVFSYEQI